MNPRALAIAAVFVTATGCGLVDPNIADFDLSLPDRTFTVDTSQWMLDGQTEMPTVSCTVEPNLCADLATQLCSQNETEDRCVGVCNGTSCELVVSVARHTPVDLFNEKPELKTIEDQPLIEVEIDRVLYEVTENELEVATPEIVVYAAPQSVMSPDGEGARPIGVIESIPAQTRQETRELAFSDAGRATLREFMSDFKTPFNILVGSDLVVLPGQPLPTGRLEARVGVQAHAGL